MWGVFRRCRKRSLSVAIQCPTSQATIGLPPLPVNVTYLGNCAYVRRTALRCSPLVAFRRSPSSA